MEEVGLTAPKAGEDPFLRMDDDAYLIVDREIPELAAQRKLPSAFVCANDFFAYLILRSLIANGVKVPEDVAVTGFDHTDEERDPTLPSLSTIHVPNAIMGKRAVEMLFNRLADPDRPFEKTMIHGGLLLRESFRKEYAGVPWTSLPVLADTGADVFTMGVSWTIAYAFLAVQ